ncbi:hypothetical protein COLO4_33794 [Corchorus olitorius]|uniref:Uncharacterized protein n=1 Tax=Corchorus olitorius TaxID=93759 RepID=A0A1R3GRB0_9ROSI|nr:hypothetical protein COLO4_33794 [Corchorus olitorius]
MTDLKNRFNIIQLNTRRSRSERLEGRRSSLPWLLCRSPLSRSDQDMTGSGSYTSKLAWMA